MDEPVVLANQNVYFTVTNVLVLNEKNQILVLRRSEWKRIPGEYYRPDLSHQTDLPGGMVGDQAVEEDVTTGALRELFEETGIEAPFNQARLAYAETSYRKHGERSQARLVYLLKLDHTPTVSLSWEHESFEWVPIAEVVGNNYLHSGVHRRAVDYIVSHPTIFNI